MANVYAVKSGNWSDPTVWNTGVVPTSSDDVRSNTFTITIDQDIVVASLRGTPLAPAAAGGTFLLTGSMPIGGRTVIGDLYAQGAPALSIGIIGTGSHTGNIFGGSANNSQGIRIFGSGICQVNTNGTVTPSPSTQNGNGILIENGNSTTNIVGTLLGSAALNTYGVLVNANSIVNITGTINGGSVNPGLLVNAAAVVTINGNATGTAGAAVINNSGGSFLYGNFNAIGSSTSTAVGVFGNTVNPNWAVTNIVNTTSSIGIGGAVRVSSTNPTWTFITPLGTNLTLTNPTSSTLPAINNVRLGTVYGGGAFVGTLAMPPSTSVSYGVAVDNTTGSAILTANNFFAAVSSSSDPVAVRLRNVSTVETTGDQLDAIL